MRFRNRLNLTNSKPPKPGAWDETMRVLLVLFSFLMPFRSAAIAEPVDYEKQVKPIFAARCKACHGALKQEGGLRLDTGALVRAGGDSGEAVAAGGAAASMLLTRITAKDSDERMPQE